MSVCRPNVFADWVRLPGDYHHGRRFSSTSLDASLRRIRVTGGRVAGRESQDLDVLVDTLPTIVESSRTKS